MSSYIYLQSYQISDDYCGKHNFNYYIDGGTSIEAEAAVTFPYITTAVTVDKLRDYTVAIIGTNDGHLLKVCIGCVKYY